MPTAALQRRPEQLPTVVQISRTRASRHLRAPSEPRIFTSETDLAQQMPAYLSQIHLGGHRQAENPHEHYVLSDSTHRQPRSTAEVGLWSAPPRGESDAQRPALAGARAGGLHLRLVRDDCDVVDRVASHG
jgi:hypothetical protein